MSIITTVDELADALEVHGNNHGTEAQADKATELLRMAVSRLPADEAEVFFLEATDALR